ncbi:MAG TPA: AAA family ATPase [Candidatus Binatia bacterium]|nr:AAA family ATPase [Candidatus Binatia bacterium]
MYNIYFGFSVSPFSVTPDPSFFYSNPVYREAYANLRYGIEDKKGFIVITGEVGTGKTTLLRKLMHNLEGTIHSVFIFNTYLNFPELLQVILHDLGLATKEANKVTMLQELNDYLITQLKQAHIVSVLVDEAQDLTDEALEGLRLLSNLETDQEKLIQIVLMGQPELQARLDRPNLRQLKQRIALQCRLVPLKDEEVGPYIDFRLRAAGYKGKDLFHRDALQQIAFYSNGIPRLINIICDNALLCAYARSQKIVTADMIKEVARDLGLGSKGQVTEAQITPPLPVSETQRETPIRTTANDVPQHKVRHLVRVGVETFLAILAVVAAVSFIDPLTFFSIPRRGLQVAKHNLNQWVLFITHQDAVPAKANAEVKFERKEQRVIIPHGSTIYKIAMDAYRANTALGMDLIKELNPEIKNLNKVSAGQDLLLPSLTRETLLRKQPDGSYRLIVASFHSLTGADEYARLLRNKGYQVTITPRRVSDNLLVHRVEIDGLKNVEQANQIWETGLRNEWLAVAGNPGGMETR